MRVVHTIKELRGILGASHRTALVPTMGSLHEGHLSLVRMARSRDLQVVTSIFVNRLQFAPTDDFDQYPRTLSRDCELLEKAGCDILFAPPEREIYPEPQRFKIQPPEDLANVLEGQFRPGFFTGVCTIVLKLFNIVQPQLAVFGKKDYQQLLVIRHMATQLALPIEVMGGETVRERDGLAMSSRNAYLSPAERIQAAQLHAALELAAAGVRAGRCDWNELQREAGDTLTAQGWTMDYLAIRQQSDLGAPVNSKSLVVLAAARLGTTRLIDNIECRF